MNSPGPTTQPKPGDRDWRGLIKPVVRTIIGAAWASGGTAEEFDELLDEAVRRIAAALPLGPDVPDRDGHAAELAEARRWLGIIHSSLDPEGELGSPGDWSVTADMVRMAITREADLNRIGRERDGLAEQLAAAQTEVERLRELHTRNDGATALDELDRLANHLDPNQTLIGDDEGTCTPAQIVDYAIEIIDDQAQRLDAIDRERNAVVKTLRRELASHRAALVKLIDATGVLDKPDVVADAIVQQRDGLGEAWAQVTAERDALRAEVQRAIEELQRVVQNEPSDASLLVVVSEIGRLHRALDASAATAPPQTPQPPTGEPRCSSCDHTVDMHQPDGCWFTVETGKGNLVCACSVPASMLRRVDFDVPPGGPASPPQPPVSDAGPLARAETGTEAQKRFEVACATCPTASGCIWPNCNWLTDDEPGPVVAEGTPDSPGHAQGNVGRDFAAEIRREFDNSIWGLDDESDRQELAEHLVAALNLPGLEAALDERTQEALRLKARHNASINEAYAAGRADAAKALRHAAEQIGNDLTTPWTYAGLTPPWSSPSTTGPKASEVWRHIMDWAAKVAEQGEVPA